jgi:hypothetical protein
MVGNILGTSLAMAPAYILGQLCKVVAHDGPIFLKADREITADYPGRLYLVSGSALGWRLDA